MEKNARISDLLQPPPAGFPRFHLVLLAVVKHLVQGCHELLREGTDGGHETLAENHVSSELWLTVCDPGEHQDGFEKRHMNHTTPLSI